MTRIRRTENFEGLFALIDGLLSPISGTGELYIYDTAFRIGAKMGVLPQKVYLHAGTRVGARKLGIDYKTTCVEDCGGTSIAKEVGRHDLAQLVIALGINLRALRAEDIPELQGSPHLAAFQQLIRTAAKSIPRHAHLEDYEDTLQAKAEEIVNAWHKTQADLGDGLKKIFLAGLFGAGAEAGRQLLGVPFDVTKLFVEAGIGIFGYMGTQAIDQDNNAPYQYLTQVQQAENPILRGTFPLGIA